MRIRSVVLLSVLLTVMASAEEHPIYDPDGDVEALRSKVDAVLHSSDDELRARLSDVGDDDEQNVSTVQTTYDLALLYHLTGDVDYARRAALLLERYAEVFPQWPKSYDGYYNSTWGFYNFNYDNHVAKDLALAFDLIYHSDQFTDRDAVYEFLRDVVIADLRFRVDIHNEAYYRGHAWVVFGRVLQDPQLVHLGLWFYTKMNHELYCHDGFSAEGSYDYHGQNTYRFTNPEMAKLMDGYVDPPEYQHVPIEPFYDPPITEPINMQQNFGDSWRRQLFVWKETLLPNGHYVIMNDTWHYDYNRNGGTPATASTLMHGIGHAILALGAPDSTQTQVRLDFTPSISHYHADANQLFLFAKGKEVIGGTGYGAGGKGDGNHVGGNRGWNTSSFSQNLVVVNGKEQKGAYYLYWTNSPYIPGEERKSLRVDEYLDHRDANHHNNLLLWEPGYAGQMDVQVVEVDAQNAYRDVASLYQRFLGLVRIEATDGYVLDFFRLRGGTNYRWQVHGGHDPYELSTSLQHQGVKGAIGGGSWYDTYFWDGVQQLQQTQTDSGWMATMKYGDAVQEDIHMVGAPQTTVTMGTAQSVAPYPENVYVERDHLLVERSGTRSTTISFLAVHEVHEGRPRVQSVTQLDFEGDAGSAVGVQIQLEGGFIDYVVHTLDEHPPHPEHRVAGVDLAMQGRFAHVRTRNGQVIWMKLLQGNRLVFGDRVITPTHGDFSHRGSITSVRHAERGDVANAFETATVLPPGEQLAGKAVIVQWGNGWTWGYTIDRIDGRWMIVREEPGFDVEQGEVKMRYFPHGTYPGPVTFTIPGSAYMDSTGDIVATAPVVSATVIDDAVTSGEHQPLSFTLSQNYNNPFNLETTIHFGLPSGGEVDLTVYDSAGQRVANLVAGFRDAGDHRLTWSAQDDEGRRLSSGVYFYRLTAGNQVLTRKLVFLK